MTANHRVNRTADKRYLPVCFGLRPTPAGYMERQASRNTMRAPLDTLMFQLRRHFTSLAVALGLVSASCLVSAEESAQPAWPATIVKFEDLSPLTDFQLRVPGLVRKGRVIGPAILRAHITAAGTVARVALLESCGNPDLDEASMHAMRVMQFKPSALGGVPTEVTLVVPVHVPPRYGRSPR